MSRQSAANKPGSRSPVAGVIDAHRQDAVDSWQRLRRAPLSTLMTVTVIAVALLLPACLALVNTNLQSVVAEFRGSARINLYLEDGTSAESGHEVSTNLQERAAIQSAEFVSSQDALGEFAAATGLGDVLAALPDNPLPATIVVTPEPASPDLVSDLAAELQLMPEVQSVQMDEAWVRRVNALADTVSLLARMLGLLIAVGVCFIVGNTIRATVESRRDEIRVIKLVGGTDSFIARPLLYAGLLQGAAGGLLAALLLALLSWGTGAALQGLGPTADSAPAPLLTLQGPGLGGMILLLTVGALLGWLAALGASWRYVRAVAP